MKESTTVIKSDNEDKSTNSIGTYIIGGNRR